MKIQRKIKGALFLAIFVCGLMTTVPGLAKPAAKGIYVQYHTQKEIKNYVKKHKFGTGGTIRYAKKPSLAPGSYSAGSLQKSSLKEGLNALNTMRYIAGIPADVKLDSGYNKKCQSAALLNAANNQLSHYPAKPSGMKEALYKLGAEGAGSSNLAYTSWQTNLAYSVGMWMDDSDQGNIDRLGHRRWVLDPYMKKTGFGYVNGYSGMYAFDGFNRKYADVTSTNPASKYYGVAWPAQNMPVEYFNSREAWSISMGRDVDSSKVKVTLTRKRDKKKWVFSKKKANGYFNVNNAGYGQSGCIIFRPDNISYQSGDVYQVKITGAGKTVSYEVRFFRL